MPQQYRKIWLPYKDNYFIDSHAIDRLDGFIVAVYKKQSSLIT